MTRKHTYIKTQFALSISPFPSLSLLWFEDGTAGAFLVAQRIKRLPAMQETWVRSLGWEDSLERKWQPTPIDRGA